MEMDNMSMDLPKTTKFINGILSQVSRCVTSTTAPPGEAGLEIQTQRHPRLTKSESTSAFPNSQVTNLKPLMLTLHCVFPNEFLLALDILDRGLVRRVRTRCRNESGERNGDEAHAEREPTGVQSDEGGKDKNKSSKTQQEDFFFVTSASIASSTLRPSFPASQPGGAQSQLQTQKQWQEEGYEVRLQAWNCTCPSFTLSAFHDLDPEPSSPPPSSSSSDQGGNIEGNDSPMAAYDGGGGTSVDANVFDTAAYSFGGTLPLHTESAPPVCKHILACLLAALCPGLDGGDGATSSEQFVSLDRDEIAALCAGWGG